MVFAGTLRTPGYGRNTGPPRIGFWTVLVCWTTCVGVVFVNLLVPCDGPLQHIKRTSDILSENARQVSNG